MHIVQRAYRPRISSSWQRAVVRRRAPDIPSGWPSAIAPPLGFICSASSGRPRSRNTARAWEANASLSSMTSISASLRPDNASTLRVAGAGPMPITRGGTPAVAMARMRARGVRPCLSAAASDASNNAHAPSLTPDALPAVTVPSGRTTHLSLANCSTLVSGRGCSSISISSDPPLF